MVGVVQSERAAATARMKAYMADHLRDRITAHDVAQAAGYSQFHATRLFKAETGMSPFEYLRRERLTAAAHELRTSDASVLDIALDFVFDSHEGFTRAFANAFGIPPKRFSTRPTPEGWLIPVHYLDRNRRKRMEPTMSQTAVIFTQIVERPARKLILRRSQNAADYFAYVEEVGSGDSNNSAPWDILTEIRDALYEPVGLWLPANMQPEGTGSYAHGVEVASDYAGDIPEGFDVIELVPCKMMVFQGEPYDDDSFQEAVGACMEQIAIFNPEVYGYRYALELAPRMQLAPQGWRGYIEMLPIEPIR